MKPRNLYKLCQESPTGDGILADIEVDGIGQQQLDEVYTSDDEDNIWVRDDLPGITIDDNNEVL